MPKEAVMTRNTLLARCSAAAAAATLLAGLAAAPASARPDPGESTQQIQLDEGTKAQIEHDEQLYLDGRTKAQIEHDEQQSVSSTGDENVATSSSNDEFPWAVASLAAAGFVAVAAGGVVMQRQRKTALASA
jgi:hypothetical protein